MSDGNRVISAELIPWEDGQQGVSLVYADGRCAILPLSTAPCDGSPQGRDAKQLDPKDDSAVAAGEAPHPTPPGETHVDR